MTVESSITSNTAGTRVFPGPRNATQIYVTSRILGSTDSLAATLQAIPLPTDNGPSRFFYDSATSTAIDQSRRSLEEGLRRTIEWFRAAPEWSPRVT